jgi:hypothetical protein
MSERQECAKSLHLSVRIIRIRIEKLLSIDLVASNTLLPFRRNQPVDELLAKFFLYVRVLHWAHQHHPVLIKETLITFDNDGEDGPGS